VEGRLKRLEASTRKQCSPVNDIAGSALLSRPSSELLCLRATASDARNSTSDLVNFDMPSSDLERNNFPSTHRAHSTQHVQNLHNIVDSTRSYGYDTTKLHEPASFCSSNPEFVRSLDTGWSMASHSHGNTDRLPQVPNALWKHLDSSVTLPTRAMADDLLHSFFAFVHDFLPIFHKPTFEKRYEVLWAPNAPLSQPGSLEHLEHCIFLATLNICFALGSLFSQLVPDEDRNTTGDEYYQRSRMLTNFHICDYSSLSAVRLQLATGLYLQITSHSSRCWNVVGMAIRIAQDLELHRDPAGRAGSNQMDIEMRRRLWHSCVTMEM
jgi:hypothetical protein